MSNPILDDFDYDIPLKDLWKYRMVGFIRLLFAIVLSFTTFFLLFYIIGIVLVFPVIYHFNQGVYEISAKNNFHKKRPFRIFSTVFLLLIWGAIFVEFITGTSYNLNFIYRNEFTNALSFLAIGSILFADIRYIFKTFSQQKVDLKHDK